MHIMLLKKHKKLTLSNCSSLTNAKIPFSVKLMKSYVFLECSSLTEIHIPSSLISICYYAYPENTKVIKEY